MLAASKIGPTSLRNVETLGSDGAGGFGASVGLGAADTSGVGEADGVALGDGDAVADAEAVGDGEADGSVGPRPRKNQTARTAITAAATDSPTISQIRPVFRFFSGGKTQTYSGC